MVTIIIPLCIEVAGQDARGIVVVFQHQMDLTVRTDGCREPPPPFRRANLLRYGVNRVKAQSIEAILQEPVQRIFGEEAADLLATKIYCRPPRRRHVGRETFRGA